MKKLAFLCFLLIFLAYGDGYVFAMKTGFETMQFDALTYQKIMNNITITVSPVERTDSIVRSFSVNEFGGVAVCLGSGDVNIYDYNGIFKYRYVLGDIQTYTLEWDQKNLLIERSRSGCIISVDENGNILELLDTDVPGSSNADYSYHTQRINKFTYNNNTYEGIKGSGTNSPLELGFSKIIKISDDSSETVIYDASEHLLRETLINVIFYVIALSAITFRVLKTIWTQKLKNE